MVSCGNHEAPTCRYCAGNSSGCNGDCEWSGGKCIELKSKANFEIKYICSFVCNRGHTIQFHGDLWSSELAPPHVLWQVSFGCWVTWSISSWQKCYKSVFFFNFTKLQFLTDKIYIYTKKNYLAFCKLQNWCFGQFYHSKICKIEK